MSDRAWISPAQHAMPRSADETGQLRITDPAHRQALARRGWADAVTRRTKKTTTTLWFITATGRDARDNDLIITQRPQRRFRHRPRGIGNPPGRSPTAEPARTTGGPLRMPPLTRPVPLQAACGVDTVHHTDPPASACSRRIPARCAPTSRLPSTAQKHGNHAHPRHTPRRDRGALTYEARGVSR